MSGVFISYRRSDCAAHAGRLYDRFAERFGEQHVFMDIDSISPGTDFAERLEAAIGTCDVLVALIGDDWLTITDRQGRRRIDDPTDFVRVELASALARSGLPVIPVLVERATMPDPELLPGDLKSLVRRQAVELSDTRWRHDVERLLEVVEKTVAIKKRAKARSARRLPSGTRPARWRSPLAWLVATAFITAAAYYVWNVTMVAMTTVPPLTGARDSFTARSVLERKQLVLGRPIAQRTTDNADPGSVLQQSPAAGTRVATGSAVRIVVAKADLRVSVPNVKGLTRAKADERLRRWGLELGEDRPASAPENWIVSAQIPSSDLLVPTGTAVRVFLRAPAPRS